MPERSFAKSVDKAEKSGIIKSIDVDEVHNVLINNVGFSTVEDSFKNVDNDLQISNTNPLLKLEKKFGCIHKSTSNICSRTDGDALAYVSCRRTDPSTQNLSLSPRYFSSKSKLISTEKNCVESGWNMPADTSDDEMAIYTVTHEYGHILQNTLIKREYERSGWTSDNARAFVDDTKKTAEAKYKWYSDRATKVEKECYNEIIEIAKENNKDFKISDNISEYCRDERHHNRINYSEFFAEVFANSQLSKPNELGKAMNIWLERKGLIVNDT